MSTFRQGCHTDKVRTFLAIRLPLEMAATLNKKARHRAGAHMVEDIRWAAPQQQHITLRFLGESSTGQLEQLKGRLEAELLHDRFFDCMTGRFEFFPNARQPRVLALGMHSGQELKRLAALCEKIAIDCGYPREARDFRPHVTLGRFKTHRHVTHSQFFNLPSYRMTAFEVVLMQSELLDSGTRYKTIHSFPLQPLAVPA